MTGRPAARRVWTIAGSESGRGSRKRSTRSSTTSAPFAAASASSSSSAPAAAMRGAPTASATPPIASRRFIGRAYAWRRRPSREPLGGGLLDLLRRSAGDARVRPDHDVPSEETPRRARSAAEPDLPAGRVDRAGDDRPRSRDDGIALDREPDPADRRRRTDERMAAKHDAVLDLDPARRGAEQPTARRDRDRADGIVTTGEQEPAARADPHRAVGPGGERCRASGDGYPDVRRAGQHPDDRQSR